MPITIYSQHDRDEISEILTIQPEEDFFTRRDTLFLLSHIKTRIEEELGLPRECQVIYNDMSQIRLWGIKDVEKIEPAIYLRNLLSSNNDFQFYLTGLCKGNEAYSQICRQSNIKILEIQIVTPSGSLVAEWQPTGNCTNLDFLKDIVEEKYSLPRITQIFYSANFKHLPDYGVNVWSHFGRDMIDRRCKVYLFTRKTSSINTSICNQLGIPRISPEFIVKSLDGIKELHRVNMDLYVYDENNPVTWFTWFKEVFAGTLPAGFILIFNGEIIDSGHKAAKGDWEDLYFHNGTVREEIVFNLTYRPTSDAGLQKFCEDNEIPILKTLKLKFLTSVMDIDLCKVNVESILNIKNYISDEKQIPVDAIGILLNERVLQDAEKLSNLFIENGKSTTNVEFHIVMKPLKNVRVHLKTPYTNRLILPVDQISVSGTHTIYNVKEEISTLTAIPICQLKLTYLGAAKLSDKTFIHDIAVKRKSNDIEVTVWKTVSVSKEPINDEISEIYEIKDDEETVQMLLSRLNLNKDFKLIKSGKITRKTLLHDLKSDDTIELRKAGEGCSFM